ncbi:hypothetical protein MBLNU230_g7780t1 [Neophaeotheca triangularis]
MVNPSQQRKLAYLATVRKIVGFENYFRISELLFDKRCGLLPIPEAHQLVLEAEDTFFAGHPELLKRLKQMIHYEGPQPKAFETRRAELLEYLDTFLPDKVAMVTQLVDLIIRLEDKSVEDTAENFNAVVEAAVILDGQPRLLADFFHAVFHVHMMDWEVLPALEVLEDMEQEQGQKQELEQ